MDRETLEAMERAGSRFNKYVFTDEVGNIVEQWEKDEEGIWQDKMPELRRMQEIEKAEAEFRKAAKANGVSDEDIDTVIRVLREEHGGK